MIAMMLALALQAQTPEQKLEEVAQKLEDKATEIEASMQFDPYDPASVKSIERLKNEARHRDLWVQIGESNKATVFMRAKDIQSIHLSGLIWVKFVNKQGDKIVIGRDRVDCQNETTTVQSVTTYKQDGTVQSSFSLTPAQQESASAVPDSIGEAEVRATCKVH